jgi:succinylglutamic semialdehyde dehydrogenase
MDPMISRSPWNGEVVAQLPPSDEAACAVAVAEAEAAFPEWSRDHARRRAALERLSSFVIEARSRIIDLLVREAGKNHADAGAEADLLPKKIAITLDAAMTRTPQTLAMGADPQVVWRPRGVAAILGPFNFPLHLLHGLVAPALAVGCTVVAKPSERCPGLGALYAELLRTAGLARVCHVLGGGAAAAQAIISQPAVATVAAVGGRGTGLALARALAGRPEVVLALELGGVNPAVVLEDADIDAAAGAIADGAWRMAGQRCTATRQAHVPRRLLAPFLTALQRERLVWRPDGTPAGNNGAMIDGVARERFLAPYRGLPAGMAHLAGDPAQRFAASQCVDPLLLELRDPAVRDHALYREEHFGPALIVDAYDDVDECLARLAANPYRLAASVFTASRERFLALAPRLPYGQVNHNRPTAGARSDQPFGGLGLSGNARPAALAAGAIFADESVVW